jgi:hypothetical protein
MTETREPAQACRKDAATEVCNAALSAVLHDPARPEHTAALATVPSLIGSPRLSDVRCSLQARSGAVTASEAGAVRAAASCPQMLQCLQAHSEPEVHRSPA